jgi:hypothetical protein
MYVYRNGVLIGEAEVQISDPRRPLGAGVFVVLDGVTHESSPLAPDRPKRRWMAVGLPSHNGQLPARHEIGERIHPPAQFSRLVYELLQPGATLMITDRPALPETRTQPGFRIMVRTFAKPVNSSYPRKRVSRLFSGLLDSRLRGNDGKRKSWANGRARVWSDGA